MELIELQENISVIQGGANIGVIAHEGRCLIIDSGMDKDTGQNILKQVKKLGLKTIYTDILAGLKTQGFLERTCQEPLFLSMHCIIQLYKQR